MCLGVGSIQGSFLTVTRFEGNAFGRSNVVNQKTDTTLGNNIGDAVSQLNGDNDTGAGQTKHRENVDNRITVSKKGKWNENILV